VDAGPLLYTRGTFDAYDRFAIADARSVMEAVAASFPDAASCVDVGAGTGRYVHAARQLGLDAAGVERSGVGRRMARERIGVDLIPFRIGRSSPISADLAYSFEVAEHVPARRARRFVEFVSACAPLVIMTAASPGQGGTGHLNEQPRAYWVDLFSEQSFSEDEDGEARLAGLLSLEKLSPHWRTTNLFVFHSGQR
jgi:hypothetical protein